MVNLPEVVEADVLINVPIATQHSVDRLSLGTKNLLGVVTAPNRMLRNEGQRVAGLASPVRPTLTVVDVVRTPVAHGPTGGSLSDVVRTDTIIASPDMVAADAWASTFFDPTGKDVSYVKAAAEMGLGRTTPLRLLSASKLRAAARADSPPALARCAGGDHAGWGCRRVAGEHYPARLGIHLQALGDRRAAGDGQLLAVRGGDG